MVMDEFRQPHSGVLTNVQRHCPAANYQMPGTRADWARAREVALRCAVWCGVAFPGERGTNTHLGVGRLLRSESSAHQFRGAHRGSRAERMECASGVNAEGEDAKDGAEHDGSSRCRKRTKMFVAS